MDKEKLIQEISNSIRNCKKCRLCETAINPVPGEGNINTKIVFIGEAPGFNEDATGRPFVGRAGKLLEASLGDIGYKREEVWIGNVIKHRPPENREPLPDEITACKPYLDLQLKTISPVLVVTLGRYAMNYFYPAGKISQDRGNLIKIKDYYIYPVYHPAAALRGTGVLQEFKKDFNIIPEMLIKAEDLIKNGETNTEKGNDLQDPDGQLVLGL